MEIMAAGVHDARFLGGIGQPGPLCDGERVHIRPETDGLTGPPTLDDGDSPSPGTGGIGNPPFGQLPADKGGSVMLLVAQLRLLVKRLEDAVEKRRKRLRLLLDLLGHRRPPCPCPTLAAG